MITTAIVFFIILSILVFIHEFGHFLAARFFGVGVEEFGFGLPPRALGKKIKGTIYSINYLPIGGFVRLTGEEEESGGSRYRVWKSGESKIINRGDKIYFWARTKKERAVILIAGVFMNFILAVGITTYLLTQGVPEPSGKVHVERIQEGSPAQQAELEVGDIIISIEGQSVSTPKQLIEKTKEHLGTKVLLVVIRDGNEQAVDVLARKDPPQGQGAIGIAISDLETKYYSVDQAPIEAVRINLWRGSEMLKGIGVLLWRVVTLQPVRDDVAGPIGIAAVTGEAVRFGWKAVLEFMSILSLNLAVINILPIPALDGGRLAFLFAEKLLGRKFRPAFEQKTHQFGMIILIFLILLISINDILRLSNGGS